MWWLCTCFWCCVPASVNIYLLCNSVILLWLNRDICCAFDICCDVHLSHQESLDAWEVRMHADSVSDCSQVNTLISVFYNYVAFYPSHHWNLCLQLTYLYSQVLGLEVASPCHRERRAMVKLRTSMCDFHAILKLFQSAVLDFSYNILAIHTAWWVAHCSPLSHYTCLSWNVLIFVLRFSLQQSSISYDLAIVAAAMLIVSWWMLTGVMMFRLQSRRSP